MIKQFSVVLQGKQIHTPALHDDQRVPTRDYISSQDLATPDCIVSSLSLLPMSSSDTATPKNTFFGQTMDQRRTSTVDAFRFAYLQKPLAPSPLVNTPLSGKKLPILIKAKNRNEFDEPTAAESPNENSNVKDSDLVLDPPTSSQTVTNKWNQNEVRKVDLRKLEAMNTLKQPRDLPLPLISCLSLPLIKKKDENLVPLTTKLGVGNNSSDYLSEERETKANFSRQSLLENKCLEISQMPINQLNISGAKLRTPVCRRRKFETPKFSRVRYWRGVSSFGAHVTYCSHAPYRARKKGVPPKLTVCKQYVICCDKKLQPNKCPKVDMLFNLAQEETTEEEDNDTRTDLSQGILTSQSTKTHSAIPVTEKELCTPKGNESMESLSSQNCAEKVKLSLQDVQVSPAKSLEMFTSRSRLKNQLSLHDDFPFHCFLLFQFEDRKKAMKRLMRLPQRYQQSLFKIKTKRQGGVSTFKRDKKPNYKPSVEQSHLQKNNLKRKASQEKIRIVKETGSNSTDTPLGSTHGSGTQLLYSSTLPPKDSKAQTYKDGVWEVCDERPLSREGSDSLQKCRPLSREGSDSLQKCTKNIGKQSVSNEKSSKYEIGQISSLSATSILSETKKTVDDHTDHQLINTSNIDDSKVLATYLQEGRHQETVEFTEHLPNNISLPRCSIINKEHPECGSEVIDSNEINSTKTLMTERLGSDSVTESLETCSSALCTHSLETPITSEDKFLQNVTIRRTPSNKVSNKRNFFKKGPMPRILPSRTLKPRMKTRTLQGKAKSATNFDLTEGNNGIQNIQNSERIELQNPNLTGNNSSSLDDSNQNDSGIRRDQIKVHTSSVPINHQSDSASTKDVHGQCPRESDDPFLSRYTPSTSSKVDAGDWSTNNDRLITRESQPLISTNPQKSTSKELYTSSPFSRSPDKTLSQPMINKEEFPKDRRNRSPALCSSQPPQGRQTERPAINIRPPGSYCSDRSSLTGDPLESTCSKKLLPISACSDNSPSPNVSCCYESPDSGISSENKHFIPQAGSRVSLLPAFLLDATHSADSHGRIKTVDCQMSNLNVQSSHLQTNSTKCTPKERNSGAINRNSFSVVNSFIIATETLYRSKNSVESNTHKPRLRLKSHPFSASSKESVLDTTKIDFSKRMESSLLKFPVGPPSSRAHCKVDTLQTNQHVTYCNGPALNSLPSIILDSWTKAAGDYKRKF